MSDDQAGAYTVFSVALLHQEQADLSHLDTLLLSSLAGALKWRCTTGTEMEGEAAIMFLPVRVGWRQMLPCDHAAWALRNPDLNGLPAGICSP